MVTIALALAALIMAPAIYLFVPVLLPLDLVPHGLKKAVAPKIVGKEGGGFVKVLLSELEAPSNARWKRSKTPRRQPPALQATTSPRRLRKSSRMSVARAKIRV